MPPPNPPICEVHSPFTDSLMVRVVAVSTEFAVVPRASTHLPAWIAELVAVDCLVYVVLDEVVAVTDFAVLPVDWKTNPLLVTEVTVPVRPPIPPPNPRPPACVPPLEGALVAVLAVQSLAGRMVTELAVTELGTV